MKISRIAFAAAAMAANLLAAGLAYSQDRDSRVATADPVGKEGLAYAVMNGSNTIAVIDIEAKKIIGKIAVKGNPHGGVITPDGTRIYTASMGAEKIYVVDTRTRKTVKSIDLGAISHHAAITPDGRYVYVAAKDIVVIDTKTDRIVTRIATEEPPFYLEFAPDGGALYVLNIGSTVTVIDPSVNKVTATIRMNNKSVMGHSALLPNGRFLYATNDADDTVSVIDTSSRKTVATIGVGHGPHGVAATRDGKFVYVANRGETTFSVIDTSTRTVAYTREVGKRPEHFSATPDGKYVFLGINTGSDKILVIDPTSSDVVQEIRGWPAVHAILFHQPQSKAK